MFPSTEFTKGFFYVDVKNEKQHFQSVREPTVKRIDTRRPVAPLRLWPRRLCKGLFLFFSFLFSFFFGFVVLGGCFGAVFSTFRRLFLFAGKTFHTVVNFLLFLKTFFNKLLSRGPPPPPLDDIHLQRGVGAAQKSCPPLLQP